MIRLVPAAGADLGPGATWSDGRRVLGRSPTCDVVVRVLGVSQAHCTIEARDGGYWVNDLESTNGTYCNGERVTAPRRLEHGDAVALGAFTLRVEISVTGIFAAQPRFVVAEGTAVRDLLGERLIVGRRAESDLVVGEPRVSRVHCRIEHDAGTYWLRDLQSRNGTFVNGRRVLSHRLGDGDAIELGRVRPGETQVRLLIALEDGVCRVEVERQAPSAATAAAGETAPHTVPSLVPSPGGEGQPPASAPGESSEFSLVIRGLAKGKALHRGPKWVPTSDILPDRRLRAAIGAVVLALPLGALLVAFTGWRAPLAPGPLAAVHRGERFARSSGLGTGDCSACHRRGGVPDPACGRCHAAVFVPAPHDLASLTGRGLEPLACTTCHQEHRGELDPLRSPRWRTKRSLDSIPHPGPALAPPDGLCLDCHRGAHSSPPGRRDAAGQAFLNVFYSSAWTHALHARRPPCADCHASAEDRAEGRVSTPCEGCHGGAGGSGAGERRAFADSWCLTCHYLHRSGPLLPKREEAIPAAEAGAAGHITATPPARG